MNCPSPAQPAKARPLWRAVLCSLLALPAIALAAPYELGRGYPLPILGLTAGGYLSVQANALEGEPSKASLQDLSLFLHGDPSADWHFFTEIEVSNPISATKNGLTGTDTDLDIERFYFDHNLSARTTLRLGKYLTPVGRWNQIHADPLVWTVSRPLSTSAAFAHNASGAQLYGSWPMGRSSVDYQLFLDDTAELDPTEGHERTYPDLGVQPNPLNSFKHGAGARLQYRTFDDALQAGLSYAHFTLKDLPGYKNLLGADLFYSHDEIELSGEAVYRHDSNPTGRGEWGGHVQLVVPLVQDFYGVGYVERYKSALFDTAVNTTSLGITYRPTPPFSIKLERRESSGAQRLAPDGWLFSVAVLF